MKKELVCTKKDGFWFYSIFKYQGAALCHNAIIIDNTDVERYISYILSNKIDKVIIDIWTCRFENLEFIKKINHIKYLVVWSDGRIDNSPLYELNNLIFLEVLNPSYLDLEKFNHLLFFSTNNLSMIDNLNCVKTLKTLSIIETMKQSEIIDFSNFNNLLSLDTLSLNGVFIKSLKGIEKFKNLVVLKLSNLPKLNDISDIKLSNSTLKSLRIDNCKRIHSYDNISFLIELEFIKLSYVSVPDLDFIHPLKKIKTFISSYLVVSNEDISPLRSVPIVSMYPKRNYYSNQINASVYNNFRNVEYDKRINGDESIELWRRLAP